MKIIFAGTPVFAAAALEALIAAGHEIVLVLTQPDRPAGRGMKTTASAVKQVAQAHQLDVLQPLTLKKPEMASALQNYHADVMVVAAYGLILPKVVLSIPRHGCINIHASLLPRWRGAAPIQRAILAGDEETGITIMQMDAGLDTGAMLLKQSLSIFADETSQSLHDRLCELGAQSIVAGLELIQQSDVQLTEQDDALSCYAPKITKAEAKIDWRLSAQEVDRVVRAFNPVPGAYTSLRGTTTLKIWQAKIAPIASGQVSQPGEVLSAGRDGITVACGQDALVLEMVQKSGGKKLPVADFLSGFAIEAGDVLGEINPSGQQE